MPNQMTPQEYKKVLELLKTENKIEWDKAKIRHYNLAKGSFVNFEDNDKALSYALNLIQEYEELKKAVESAGEELPEKREAPRVDIVSGCPFCEDRENNIYFNQALDLCQPILAKYKLRVEELEKIIESKSPTIQEKYMSQEIAKCHQKLEKMEQLQSQLLALREKVSVKKLIKVINSCAKRKMTGKENLATHIIAHSLAEYFEEGKDE